MSHLGGANSGGDWQTWMPDIWGWLLVELDIRSVVDIGTGYGHNAKWFLDMGCDVYGVEAEADAIAKNQLPEHRVIQHDYTTGALLRPAYDLAMALEFVEHVESQYEENWLVTVDSAQWFLMCHAVPGQQGHHHVNCQPSDYWIERLESRGFDWYEGITKAMRATCSRKPAEWGRPTLLFFGRKE